MKKKLVKLFMLAAIMVAFAVSADAQIYVQIRPPMPVVQVRPPMPAPRYVWVNGEYVGRGDSYEYHEGYWEKPKGKYKKKNKGYWNHNKKGYYWVPGHWK